MFSGIGTRGFLTEAYVRGCSRNTGVVYIPLVDAQDVKDGIHQGHSQGNMIHLGMTGEGLDEQEDKEGMKGDMHPGQGR